MKKLSLIITTVTALALITTACSISLNPPAAPPGPPPVQPQPGQPQPGQPQPGQPQPGQPQPGQPQPGQPQPGQPQPGQPQPGQPQPGQPQPGQPQPGQPPQPPTPQGPQPGQPPAPAQPTATKKSGGKPPVSATITPTSPSIPFPITAIAVVANLDLAISNIYPSSTGHIMVTLKNAGNIKISGSYQVACSGSYTDSTGNHALSLTSQYATVNLTAGQTADFDTSYSRNPSITAMYVACKVTPPKGDTNSTDDSMNKQVK